jgi:hypothetical protein
MQSLVGIDLALSKRETAPKAKIAVAGAGGCNTIPVAGEIQFIVKATLLTWEAIFILCFPKTDIKVGLLFLASDSLSEASNPA